MTVDRLSQGYQPNFDIDAAVGRQGELFCRDIAKGIADGSVEVKTDQRVLSTGNVYVEYECVRGGQWLPSGIQTTQAEFWAFSLDNTVLVAAPVADIRRAARIAYRLDKRAECKRGSHPTRGALIPISSLLVWALDGQAAA